jgi:hypothetical protein
MIYIKNCGGISTYSRNTFIFAYILNFIPYFLNKMFMKKILLSSFLGLAMSFAHAQCTPDPTAVLPLSPGPVDTLYALVGQAYSQTLTITVQQDTTVTLPPVPPLFPGGVFTLDILKQTIISIDGLPLGITSACNSSGCTWLGGQQGCVKLSGTPTVAGTYTVTVNLSTFLSDPAPGITLPSTPLPIPYTMVVKYGTSVEDVLDPDAFRFAACEPSITDGMTTMKFSSPVPQNLTFRIHDMAGRTLREEILAADGGIQARDLDVSQLSAGVYYLTLQDAKHLLTQKLIVQ